MISKLAIELKDATHNIYFSFTNRMRLLNILAISCFSLLNKYLEI